MGDIQTRPFSKNYSGLVNQSVIALGITVLCVTSQEIFKRKRRGKYRGEGLGSRESWEFGYLYQGRCWAKHPSPPMPAGWPLSWVKQAITFPEDKLNELRGIDATLYIRFLRGCFWFTLLHSLTTFPVLFPIHVEFSEDSIPPKSMTRASISSLVLTDQGKSLLWIHICFLFWITLSWMATLLWICQGAFRLRAAQIEMTTKRVASLDKEDDQYHPHPHPQYGFADIPSIDKDHPNRGLKLRTVMVSNIPPPLRDEKELKEYFEFYMSRKLEKPSMGITSSTQPGFFNKSFAFLFNRAKRLPAHLPPLPNPLTPNPPEETVPSDSKDAPNLDRNSDHVPIIDRVVIARKMTELASLLHRREEILRLLETAHIKLAKRTLLAVQEAMDRRDAQKPIIHSNSRARSIAKKRRSDAIDSERGEPAQEGGLDEEQRMELLIKLLGPYVNQFGLRPPAALQSRNVSSKRKHAFRKLRMQGSQDVGDLEPDVTGTQTYPPSSPVDQRNQGKTIWEVLHSLPRNALDAYQPLINLSHLFRGRTVPSIDYYTAKLNLLSSLITENRAKAVNDYDPVSTGFVTFADPSEARRACKYLAVHPNNPLACMVTMAPAYEDLDWIRVMKSSFNAEFVKDWVVNVGVWAFTIFWLFPVSLLVGLVSIQNISLFLPGLKSYLDKHQWEQEVIQSFLPTLLVALLALLIPLILLLIAKKAHTITTLSALHDRIMTRYYKFLIVNVLVFFCVGTAAMQTFLQSFRSATAPDVLKIVANSFPTAGPFYVGWLIFTVAMHGGFELMLLGLPLIMYPATRRQVTPRKRAVGVRPRTLNYYYWLPNHVLVIHVLLLFSVINPFVIPFGTVYFFIEAGVIKNQLIHVYAKNYEGNGQLILIRIVRYSLDGLIFAQVVFMAYMVVLKKSINVGLAAFLIVFTAVAKLCLTRMCRAQFEHDDVTEAQIICGRHFEGDESNSGIEGGNSGHCGEQELIEMSRSRLSILTWRLPAWVDFSYATVRRRPHHPLRRQPNPFGPHSQSFSRLSSMPADLRRLGKSPQGATAGSDSNCLSPSDHRQSNGLTPKPKPPPIQDTWSDTDPIGPVIPHPPPATWDDQTNCDLPYDNPFYTRTINNVLWLPRDPFGVLDLDDTVDLKRSLTVEATAGQLGTWLGLPEASSPVDISSVSILPAEPASPYTSPRPQPQFDGTEEIDLPLVIAKRVQEKKDEVERTLKPRRSSIYSRQVSGGEKTSIGRRRPSFLNVTPPISFPGGTAGRARSSSVMSTLSMPQRLVRHPSGDQDPGTRPDTHAQAEFVKTNATTSRISLVPPRLTRAQNVSSHAAIVHEVMAEEEQALAHRLEEEEAEAEKATTTKSWLTSWMFTKRPE